MPVSRRPWVDVHSHPGRCFLAGLDREDPHVRAFGAADPDAATGSAVAAGMAAVSFATVADLAVLGFRPDGSLGAVRPFAPGEARDDHRRQLEAVSATAARTGAPIVRTASDIEAAHAAGTTALFVTCEGGDFVEGDLERVAEAHRAGVRSITVVHYRDNGLGDLQTEPPRHGGLTAAGRALVAEMDRLGMVVDLAHASFRTTVDAIEASSRPIMVSHTHLAREPGGHPRLVTDEHARAVADGGGLIGAWPSGVSSRTFDDFVDEVVRLVDLVGVGHVAIGTDLDANYRPVLTDYGGFAALDAALTQRGLLGPEVDAILGDNAVTLIRAVCG